MMKKISLLLMSLLFMNMAFSQENSWESISTKKEGTLNVIYYENAPFAFTDSKNELSGIEVDIIRYFTEWLWEKKKVKVTLNFTPGANFDNFFSEVQSGAINTIGAGTVSITEERDALVSFSSPYLKNVSVLISDGAVPTLKSLSEVETTFSGMQAVTLKGSVHERHVIDIIKKSSSTTSPLYVDRPMEIPEKIAQSAKYYGYIDIVSFWTYMKRNSHYIKMHKLANIEDERFAFIFPKDSDWALIFNEFFENGFGFTSTKDYHRILEKHLGFEVIERVELD